MHSYASFFRLSVEQVGFQALVSDGDSVNNSDVDDVDEDNVLSDISNISEPTINYTDAIDAPVAPPNPIQLLREEDYLRDISSDAGIPDFLSDVSIEDVPNPVEERDYLSDVSSGADRDVLVTRLLNSYVERPT